MNYMSLAAPDRTALAIHVQRVSKSYRIFGRPEDRLKQAFLPWARRLLGRTPRSYYRDFWALKDISFDIRKGETVGIIGRNGAGKSTLLEILSGTLQPTAGSAKVSGRVAALLELGCGFNPEFSGRDNVFLYASLFGLKQNEIIARFDDIAAFADIGDFIDQPVKLYSTGMTVRLAFAVIAHIDADVLIIDEALSVGDAFFVQKCFRFLRRFMQNGTLLFVSHDTAAVASLCQRVILLQDGSIKAAGETKKIIEMYLADTHEAQHGRTAVKTGPEPRLTPPSPGATRTIDQRQNFINSSNLRNDIEIFRFDPESAGFGANGAKIVDVQLKTPDGETLTWCVGGEDVVLRISCEVYDDIAGPIVGFYVKDRLGQYLFGDNTYLTYERANLNAAKGHSIEATFRFKMPILPAGNYTMHAAIAEGTQSEHKQHHWIHDALAFKSHSSSVATGLVGIPMTDIRLEINRS